jgi:hypothetical protein
MTINLTLIIKTKKHILLKGNYLKENNCLFTPQYI